MKKMKVTVNGTNAVNGIVVIDDKLSKPITGIFIRIEKGLPMTMDVEYYDEAKGIMVTEERVELSDVFFAASIDGICGFAN